MVESSPSARMASIPIIKSGMVMHASNPSTGEVDKGRSKQDHVHLHSELKASLEIHETLS